MENTQGINCQLCSLRSPLFNYLGIEELDNITNTKKRVYFKQGETIITQGASLAHVISFTNDLAKSYIESKTTAI
jgi:hypothetical protein